LGSGERAFIRTIVRDIFLLLPGMATKVF